MGSRDASLVNMDALKSKLVTVYICYHYFPYDTKRI